MTLQFSTYFTRLNGGASHVQGAKFRYIVDVSGRYAYVEVRSYVFFGYDVFVFRDRSPAIHVHSRGQCVGRFTNRCVKDSSTSASRDDSYSMRSHVQSLNTTGSGFRSAISLYHVGGAKDFHDSRTLVVRGHGGYYLGGLDLRSQDCSFRGQFS